MHEGTGEVDAIRREVRDWLGAHWDPGMPAPAWRALVVDAGWAAPGWPDAWHGRGLRPDAAAAVAEEFGLLGAPGSGQDRTNLWAGTLVAHGRDAVKERFVGDLLAGRVAMCLLYSEPGAGSDLAALRTTARRDGDDWVVNGQKVWTSGARRADWALLLARTDWGVPKHAGISFFWFPMKQAGVEVRPLRQATGDARFNEVFLTDARVPDACMLGHEGDGWRVLQTALGYERAAMGVARVRRRPAPGADPAVAATRVDDDEWDAPEPDVSLVALARSVGVAADPVARQRLAHLHTLVRVNEANGERASAATAVGSVSPLASLGKLATSGILHTAGRLQTAILGAEATIGGVASPRAEVATYSLLDAYFTSIGGGTDQIQRNIIGERLLGLPREPDPPRGVPFRDVVDGRR